MGFFAGLREARRDDKELGQGVWRRAHDRFERGLDRFHQVLEGIEGDELYNGLVTIANGLAELQGPVRDVCRRAQAVKPSAGNNIPAGADVVHRALSKAANDLAMAAQAAAMARLEVEPIGAGTTGNDLHALENVARRAETVAAGVQAAQDAVTTLS
ncbi:hypothetical protein [Zhihengliuella halotolerans]|uniref:hypothetical protein n=1 Tax=Zhihengliuella halotolerans TaxID=370736 RepID=UPI000C81009F|nr:hypothetical protein [Zhihengliuella halotolerans]